MYKIIDAGDHEIRFVAIVRDSFDSLTEFGIKTTRSQLVAETVQVFMTWLALYDNSLKKSSGMNFWVKLCPWQSGFWYRGTNKQVPLKTSFRLLNGLLARLSQDFMARKIEKNRRRRALIAKNEFRSTILKYSEAVYQVMVRGPKVALKPRAGRGNGSGRSGLSTAEVRVSRNLPTITR